MTSELRCAVKLFTYLVLASGLTHPVCMNTPLLVWPMRQHTYDQTIIFSEMCSEN